MPGARFCATVTRAALRDLRMMDAMALPSSSALKPSLLALARSMAMEAPVKRSPILLPKKNAKALGLLRSKRPTDV